MKNLLVYNHTEHKPTFLMELQSLVDATKKSPQITLREIFSILASRGLPAIFVLFSFPFCIPIPIPGFSPPFGFMLAFLGLRFAFGHKSWCPQWILNKSVQSNHIEKLAEKSIRLVQGMQKILSPRLLFLTKSTFFHCAHGVLIFFLALLLALPLPIPLTNVVSALPIFCLGLGHLEDDGFAIIVGYVLAGLCLGYFLGIFLLMRAAF